MWACLRRYCVEECSFLKKVCLLENRPRDKNVTAVLCIHIHTSLVSVLSWHYHAMSFHVTHVMFSCGDWHPVRAEDVVGTAAVSRLNSTTLSPFKARGGLLLLPPRGLCGLPPRGLCGLLLLVLAGVVVRKFGRKI